ncbi:unnamed protein product [Ectocarpus sp. 4 AP-2014]
MHANKLGRVNPDTSGEVSQSKALADKFTMGDSNSSSGRSGTGATAAAAAALLPRLSGVYSTLMLILCCCSCRAGVYSGAGASSAYPVRALQLKMSGLAYAATSFCLRGGAFCTARGGSRRAWSWRQRTLITAIGREAVEERRGDASRRAVGVERGVWMKANKKNKRKRHQQRQGNNAAADGDGASRHKPQRVTKDAPVSVRTQIKYAKMKKSMERNNGPKKMVHNKYRRVKNTDYEDIVEQEDLSHIYMPDIAPALMVDGYNIIFHWSKCSIVADNGDLEGARRILVEELDTLAAMRGWTVTVVFDAYKRKGRARKYVTPNEIDVVFTSNGESADMYVERLTEQLKDSGCPNVMVATGDKLMQSLVVGAGAEVFSPDRIIEEIEISHSEAVAYTDRYLRRKQSMIEKSEMQDLLDRVRSAEDKAKRRHTGDRGGGRDSGPTYNIEDDF